MNYITAKEASDNWNISTRRVCILCNEGKVPGAIKKSKVWMIPANAQKPEDGRKKDVSYEINPSVLLLNPTYFEHHQADFRAEEELALCEIQNEFYKGNINEAYVAICKLINCGDARFTYVATMIKAFIAADIGDGEGFGQTFSSFEKLGKSSASYKLEKCIYSYYTKKRSSLPKYNDMNELLYNEMMPLISLLSAKKIINETIEKVDYIDGSLLEIICKELEEKDSPLISAYFHIYLAVYYNIVGHNELLAFHIKKAAQILLPRKWYLPLAEYSATLNMDLIRNIDAEAYEKILELSNMVISNYIKIGLLRDISLNPTMDKQENLQVGFKLVQGKSLKEISEELGISQYKVRQHIDDLLAVTGTTNKKELKKFILTCLFV